jgi:hypothetical protein
MDEGWAGSRPEASLPDDEEVLGAALRIAFVLLDALRADALAAGVDCFRDGRLERELLAAVGLDRFGPDESAAAAVDRKVSGVTDVDLHLASRLRGHSMRIRDTKEQSESVDWTTSSLRPLFLAV